MKRAIRWTVACFYRGDHDGGPPPGLGCAARGAGYIRGGGGIPGKRHLRKAAGEGTGDPRGVEAVRCDGRESTGQCGCGPSGEPLRSRGAPSSARRCGARQCDPGDARPEIGRRPILGPRDDRAEAEGALQRPAGGDECPHRFQCDLPGVGRRACRGKTVGPRFPASKAAAVAPTPAKPSGIRQRPRTGRREGEEGLYRFPDLPRRPGCRHQGGIPAAGRAGEGQHRLRRRRQGDGDPPYEGCPLGSGPRHHSRHQGARQEDGRATSSR